MDTGSKHGADTSTNPPPPALQDEEAPDPDEDDLDELDDILDEFSAANPTAKDAPSSSGPGRPEADASGLSPAPPSNANVNADTDADIGEDEFTRQLQAGMAELLGELEKSPEMQQQFEGLVKELGEAATAAVPELDNAQHSSQGTLPRPAAPTQRLSSTNASSQAPIPADASSFQETIHRTMQRMRDSSAQATAAAAAAASSSSSSQTALPSLDPAANPDMLLATLLKQLQTTDPSSFPSSDEALPSSSSTAAAAGAGPSASGSSEEEEEFSKMLLSMMEQLTNKEILYEPMKELHEKFPGWMSANADRVPAEDRARYEEQRGLVAEIVGRFEDPSYSDANPRDREFIVERMQRMQAAGSPPADLVGDTNAAQEALNDLDAGCPQQ